MQISHNPSAWQGIECVPTKLTMWFSCSPSSSNFVPLLTPVQRPRTQIIISTWNMQWMKPRVKHTKNFPCPPACVKQTVLSCMPPYHVLDTSAVGVRCPWSLRLWRIVWALGLGFPWLCVCACVRLCVGITGLQTLRCQDGPRDLQFSIQTGEISLWFWFELKALTIERVIWQTVCAFFLFGDSTLLDKNRGFGLKCQLSWEVMPFWACAIF